jgi:Signal transduction histidine kinase
MALALLAITLALSALAAAAELSGLDGLCVTQADEAVFLASILSGCILLVLAYLFRERKGLSLCLCGLAAPCLVFILYFSPSAPTWLFLIAFAALPPALYLSFPRNLAVSVGAVAAAAAARFAILPPESVGQRPASFRDTALFIGAPLFAAALLSLLSSLRQEADRLGQSVMALTRLNLSYQDYSLSVEEQSALEERLRITRDIHDVVGYALTNTIMTMRAASLMCEREPERVAGFLEGARIDAEAALEQVRSILGDMRRREIRSAAGPNAIAKAVRAFRVATGAQIDLDFGNFDWSAFGEAEGGDEAALATSHFVQEAMLNAFGHGKATAIRVSFGESEEGLRVRVRDNGSGAKAGQEGIGIAGMRERIEKLGGGLSYGSSGEGFAIEMFLPAGLRASDRDSEDSAIGEPLGESEGKLS